MSDLYAAIAKRAQAIAQPRADRYSHANRLYTITITRPATEPTFNRAAGVMVRAPEEPVYAGVAGITAVAPGQQIDLGDGPMYYGTVRVSIDDDAVIPPRVDDVVTIVDDVEGFAQTMGMAGRQFRTTGITQGGQLSSGISLEAAGLVPQRALDV